MGGHLHRSEAQAPPHIVCFKVYRTFTHEAMQSGRGDPCGRPCFPATTIALGIWFKIIIFGDTPNPAQGSAAPYESQAVVAALLLEKPYMALPPE